MLKLAVISPHRDDAAFSLSLAIAAWLYVGHAVTIINCFTRSEYAPFHDLAFVHDNDRLSYVSALRRREDLAWSRNFNSRLSFLDLNLKDAPLRLQCSANEVCGLPTRPDDKAMRKIPQATDRISANAYVLPLGLGSHVDHITARDAALQSKVAESPHAFYEDLPYASRPGAAETVEHLVESLDVELSPLLCGTSENLGAAVARKRHMALSYDSQIDDATADQIAAFCTRYDGRERLWVNAAWRESALAFPAAGFTGNR